VLRATANTAFSLKTRNLTFMSLSPSTSLRSVPCRFVPRCLLNCLPPLVQHEVQALDASDPIEEIQTMRESLGGTLGYFIFRLGASLAAAMGLLGLLLAIVGVYGVVSYAATQRTQELGVRMALGASPRQILALLLRQGAQLVAAGLLFGLVGAWTLTRAMSHMLVGVSPSDPLTSLSVAALLSFITLLACWIPARRAMRIDPIVALRYE